MDIYDVVIIGAGPAGLTAALYAERQGLHVVVLDNIEEQSLLAEADIVDNYPGVKSTTGMGLLKTMRDQVKSPIKSEKVISVTKNGGPTKFLVKTDAGEYNAKAIILATGATHRKAGIPGEEEFVGRGVSYCVVCDGPLFKGKRTIVIGGGNSAVKGALSLQKMGVADVKLVHRRDELRAERFWAEKIKKSGIEILWDTIPKEIKGDKFVKKIVMVNVKTKKTTELDVDGVFIEIGSTPSTQIGKAIGVETDERGFFKTNKNKETNVEGVYAAGDVSDTPLRQIVTACSDGAIAATAAYEYLKSQESKKA
ncbi:MAG: thioredoxin-disulfide reductase [Candidatus Aenigmatarchaeota archaeon]|nr:MAG: thioredoxin-disulfide reductase [Candidatus Aenigmarchaeota archaeon]